MAETPYRLGSRRTARLIRLFVYNQTLLDSGTADGMRVAEVTSATAQVRQLYEVRRTGLPPLGGLQG